MAQKPLIQLYYDVISPYAWIGFEAILRYQKHFPINLELKPFFLRKIMMTSGNRPPSFVPSKGAYIFEDLERNGQFYGIDIRPRQLAKSGTLIPKEANWLPEAKNTTEKALKVVLAVQELEPEKLPAVSRRFWTRLWSQSRPIFQENDFHEVLRSAGIHSPRKFIDHSKSPEIAGKLSENTAKALEEGCFGAPWLVVHPLDGKKECFFGADRFHLIANRLGHQGFSYEMLKKI